MASLCTQHGTCTAFAELTNAPDSRFALAALVAAVTRVTDRCTLAVISGRKA